LVWFLSARDNLGVNHARAEATISGVRAADTEETKTVVSMRYGF